MVLVSWCPVDVSFHVRCGSVILDGVLLMSGFMSGMAV